MAGRVLQMWCRYCRHIFSRIELLTVRDDTCDKCEQMMK